MATRDDPFARSLGLVTIATAIGAVGLAYYAYTKTGPTFANAALPTVGGFVVGGFVGGTLGGLLLR